jgi:hypothetical protein
MRFMLLAMTMILVNATFDDVILFVHVLHVAALLCYSFLIFVVPTWKFQLYDCAGFS